MVISKGQAWGRPVDELPDVEIADSDAELARLAVGPHPILRVRSGDLLETVGGNVPIGGAHQALPMDLGFVKLDDGTELPFVSSVIVRGRAWTGECAAIMNAAWLDDWYLGPRAHPNDGLADITVGAMSLADRLQARSRVRTGTHLPHPGLKTLRVASWEHTFARPRRTWVDGRFVGQNRMVSVRIRVDAFTLVV